MAGISLKGEASSEQNHKLTRRVLKKKNKTAIQPNKRQVWEGRNQSNLQFSKLRKEKEELSMVMQEEG